MTKNVTKVTDDATGADYVVAVDALANATDVLVNNNGDTLVNGSYAVNIDSQIFIDN